MDTKDITKTEDDKGVYVPQPDLRVDLDQLDREIAGLQTEISSYENQIKEAQGQIDIRNSKLSEKQDLRDSMVQKFPEIEAVVYAEPVLSAPIEEII